MFGKKVGPHKHFLTLTYKNLPWIQRYSSCTQFCLYCLIWDTAFWIRKSYNRAEIVVLHRMNVSTRRKEGLTGQKMSHCCPTFSGLYAPSSSWAPVQPNTLNMPKSASAKENTYGPNASDEHCKIWIHVTVKMNIIFTNCLTPFVKT